MPGSALTALYVLITFHPYNNPSRIIIILHKQTETGAFQVALEVKNLSTSAGDKRDCAFDTWVRKIPWRQALAQPTLVFLPGEFHGQRSLEGHIHRITPHRVRQG